MSFDYESPPVTTGGPVSFDLSGKRVLVVGGSRGIGEVCAVALAAAGADVAISAREPERLVATAQEITALGRTVTRHAVEVRDLESIRRLFDEVLERHDGIDILLYNAGMNIQRAAVDVSEDDWDQVVDTNLKGAFFCLQAAGRSMIERGIRGRIISIASTFSVVGFHNRAAYAASKSGLVGVTRVLAVEWAQHGINVNAIAPTAIYTEMNAPLFKDPEWRREVLSRIPLGRFAEPRDVAGAAVYLAGPAAEMVTGHTLLVDGGWTAI
jgi:NAD(P)-dependent dehydrogenase (short-subunit alcohol dehydrogenase family)